MDAQTGQGRDSPADIWPLALDVICDGWWDWHIPTGQIEGSGRTGHPDDLDRLIHPDDTSRVQHALQAHLDGHTPAYRSEYRIQYPDGRIRWVMSRGLVVSRDAQGRPLRMIGMDTDLTAQKEAEHQIWHQTHFDALTQLPNRHMLGDRLAREIEQCRNTNLQLACLFIDLDHFKEVNDSFGHDRGDALLIEAARRIARCVRDTDTAARMGGDEFAVLITGLQDAGYLELILSQLLHVLSDPFVFGTDQVFLSASIGVSVYPADTSDADDLLRNADQALYVAKGAGRRRYHYFTHALQQAAQLRVRLGQDLRVALPEQQFFVVYQPIMELATGVIHKAEALIRWQHPTRGLIGPTDFIPIAEATGLIVDIGEWVFQQAARQVKAWRTTLHPKFQISVNKSPIQFQNPNSIHTPWMTQLKQLGLGGDSIVVEITEGLLLSNSDGVIDQLLQLSDDGIGVSLDDFGTGYSSLSYLQKFDIDFVKIDQSFVRHLIADSTDLALCKAIIAMAHALDMKVIAEGVENQLQRNLLTAAGCDYAQGYGISRPMLPADFEAFMTPA